jgi:hypothetical protein
VGGASGLASGHWGIMVELEDGAATLDEDPRRPAMRSALAAAKPDDTQRWLAVVTCGGRRGEQQQLEHMAGVWQLTVWTRQSAASDSVETIGGAQTGPVGTGEPLKACGFIEFSQCMALMCPAPSDRRAHHRHQCH